MRGENQIRTKSNEGDAKTAHTYIWNDDNDKICMHNRTFTACKMRWQRTNRLFRQMCWYIMHELTAKCALFLSMPLPLFMCM